MSELFIPIILLYALSGSVSLCIRKKRIWTVSSWTMGTAGLLLSLLSLYQVCTNAAGEICGAWHFSSFPFVLASDRLTAVFCFLIGTLSLAVSVYTPRYLEGMHGNRRKYFVSGCIPFFLLSMLLVLLARTTIAFLAFWELMALISFFLVLTEYEEEKTRYAAFFYLAMTQISTVFVFAGVILLHSLTGSYEYPSALPGSDPLTALSFLFLFIGLAIKSGVIPFHKWLPHAHPAAPSPVSALMSGMMISTALYVMFRILLRFYVPELSWGFLILAFGCLTAVLGVMYALKEQDLKALLAYSSIDNTGIILIGTGLWVVFSASGYPDIALMALVGAVFHTVSHGIFKGLLFLTAGSVVQAAKTRNIDELGGLLVRMPWTGGLFFIGVLSIISIPPFSGFVGELLILQALIGGLMQMSPLMQIVMLFVISLFSLTGALTVMTFVKAFGLTFLALPRTTGAEKAREVSPAMYIGPALLAGVSAVLGIFSSQILGLLGYPGMMPDILTLSLFLLITAGLVYAAVYSFASRNTRITKTWDCGIHAPTSRMEYTGSGFTQPVVRFFSAIYRTRIVYSKEYMDPDQCLFRNGTASIYLVRFFEENFYLPLARGIERYAEVVSQLQKGGVDRYVLYVFAAVIALIVILGWSA